MTESITRSILLLCRSHKVSHGAAWAQAIGPRQNSGRPEPRATLSLPEGNEPPTGGGLGAGSCRDVDIGNSKTTWTIREKVQGVFGGIPEVQRPILLAERSINSGAQVHRVSPRVPD
jgi:hypothetical protein